MVFQKLALFPHMTAAQNVAFPLKMRRRDARTIADQVERYLDLVKLGGFGSRRIHEMSGGQPRIDEVMDRFVEFVGDDVMMAHNAPFDLRFLNFERHRISGRYFTQPLSLIHISEPTRPY